MNLLKKRVLGLRLRTWATTPLLAWGCVNLLFSTALGTRILCNKIEQKIGLPCQLESVTWSPWMGVAMNKFQVFVPAELEKKTLLFSIREIRIDVSWISLLRGKRRWERLEVNQLSANVAVETISDILALSMEGASKSAVVERPGDQEEVPHPDPESQPADQKTEETPLVQSDVPAKEHGLNMTSIPVENFEGEIIISNAKVRIFSERAPDFSVTLNQIKGEIPLWGSAR